MSFRHEIEGVLPDWRDAERRLEHVTARDADAIRREIAYHRSQYRALCSAETAGGVAERHEAEEHLGLSLSH